MTQMGLFTNQRQTHSPRDQTRSCKGRGELRGSVGVSGVSRCKLLHVEWISQVLLYSTRSYIHYPVTNHNEKEKEIISPGFFRKRTGVPLVGIQVFPSSSSAQFGSRFWCLARPVNTKPLLTVTIAEPLRTVLQLFTQGSHPSLGRWPVTSLQDDIVFLSFQVPGTWCTQLTSFLLLPKRTLPRKPMPERSVSWNTPGLTLSYIFTSFTQLSSLVFFQRLLIFRWGASWKITVPCGQIYCTPVSLWYCASWPPLSPLGFRESDTHWTDETRNYFAFKKGEISFPLELQIQVNAKRGRQLTFTNIRWEKREVQGDPLLAQAHHLTSDRGASLWSSG